MGAPKGNNYWKLRKRSGRLPKHKSVKDLNRLLSGYLSGEKLTPYTNSEFCELLGMGRETLKGNCKISTDHALFFSNMIDEFFYRNLTLYLKGEIKQEVIARELSKRGIRIEIEVKKGDSIIKRSNPSSFKQKNKDGYVYLIKAKDYNFYKIGFSTNVKRRLRDINASNPFEIEIIEIYKGLTAYDLEQSIHLKYNKDRIKNEWYKFNANQVNEIVKLINSHGST